METAPPWDESMALIRTFYNESGQGCSPIPLATMLHIHFLQQWYGNSDPAMENVVCDHMAARSFVCVGSDRVSDEKATGLFQLQSTLDQSFLECVKANAHMI